MACAAGCRPSAAKKEQARRLSVLTQDSPSINILRNVSRLYTRETGTEISFATYSYDGLSEVLSSIANTAAFDLARLDSKRWPYYMERVYTPLEGDRPRYRAHFRYLRARPVAQVFAHERHALRPAQHHQRAAAVLPARSVRKHGLPPPLYRVV